MPSVTTFLGKKAKKVEGGNIKTSLNILLYSAGCHQMFNKNAIFKYTKHCSINEISVFIHSMQVRVSFLVRLSFK